MSHLRIAVISFFIFNLSACGILPIDIGTKEDHFRLENFKQNLDDDLEYVYLMCSNKKPTNWDQPQQYVAGEHDLWVKVFTQNRRVKGAPKVARVNFDVNLEAGKSYMLNREIEEDYASVWIQEVETGVVVSEVKKTKLTRQFSNTFADDMLKCQTGTV